MLIKQKIVFTYKSTKGKYYFYILLILLYLWLEVSFNYFVISLASDIATTPSELKFIEIFGRLLSCIGCLILLFRRIKYGSNAVKYRAKCFFVAVFVIPVVYFGQKFLIDTLSYMTTGDERMRAVQGNLTKDFFIFDGAPLNATQKINAAATPFLFFFAPSPFVLNNTQLAEITKQKQSKLLNKMFNQFSEVNSKLDEMFQQYKELNKGVIKLNLAYAEEIKKAKIEVDSYWKEIEIIQDKAWETYQANIKKISMKKLDAALMNKLDNGFSSYKRGGSYSFWKDYERFTKGTVLSGTTPHDWQNGIYLPPKIWGPDKEAGRRFYHERYRALLREAKTGFFDEIKDKQKFISQDKVKIKIKDKLSSIVSKDKFDVEQISIDDKQSFESRFLKKIHEAKEASILKFTGGIPLELNRVEFLEYSIENTPLHLPFTLRTKESILLFSDYSQESFNAIVATPVIEASIDNIIYTVGANPNSFENKNENSEIGTDYVKGLLVIPLAISISLFLIFTLSLDLLLHINRYSQINFSNGTEARKIYKRPFYYVQMYPRLALLTTIVATLSFLSYLQSEQPVDFAFEKVHSFVVTVLKAIYFMGENTNYYINIKEFFEPLIMYLEELDDLVFSKLA